MTIKEIDEYFTFENFRCSNGNITLGGKNIGNIQWNGKELIYKKFEKEKDIFRKLNAWSVPSYIFNKVDIIIFTTKEHTYRLETAKAIVQYFNFKNAGVELKVYISLDQWELL